MYDFKKAIENAQRVVDKANGKDKSNFKYKLVYPSVGTLVVRILFNPKSQSIIRKILRHDIGGNKVPCYMNYGVSKDSCPICKTLKDIESLAGSVPAGSWAKPRGLFFAQYESSTYDIDGVKKGDIILVMTPKTIYDEVNSMLLDMSNSSQTAMYDAFTRAETYATNITRTQDNKYSVRPDPFNRIKSADTDDEFNAILDNLDDLSDQLVPSVLSDDIKAKAEEICQELRNTYINPKVPSVPGEHSDKEPVSLSQVVPQPSTPQVAPVEVSESKVSSTEEVSTPVVTPNKRCFGKYKDYEAGSSTDPICKALFPLCQNCQYIDQCKNF